MEKIDKKGIGITKIITYKIRFIVGTRFMVTSLSNLVENLSEGNHKTTRKYRHDNKKN